MPCNAHHMCQEKVTMMLKMALGRMFPARPTKCGCMVDQPFSRYSMQCTATPRLTPSITPAGLAPTRAREGQTMLEISWDFMSISKPSFGHYLLHFWTFLPWSSIALRINLITLPCLKLTYQKETNTQRKEKSVVIMSNVKSIRCPYLFARWKNGTKLCLASEPQMWRFERRRLKPLRFYLGGPRINKLPCGRWCWWGDNRWSSEGAE